MKTLLAAVAAAFALASVTGCDDYYVEGRAPATAYGQSDVAYPQTTQANVDPNLAVSADVGSGGGQDVVIGASSDEYSDTDPSALSDFRSTLDPYGSWVEDPNYGTVWVPSAGVVGADFTPYVSAGHWTYDDDYVWVSDYEWGWAPFHYGRWAYIGNRGWGWIPGRQYAGAWVSWRTGYDGWGYVGWAPMPPSWYWRGGYAVGIGVVPYAPYTFCAHGDIFAPSIGSRVVAGSQVGVIAGHTRPYTPATPGVGGPGRTPASPGVGGVGGPGRMGPPPSSLGLAPGQIAHAPIAQDRGLMRANQFARPSTASSLGARAPATFASSANNNNFRPSSTVATSPSYNRPAGTPQYRSVPFGTSPSYHSYSTPSYRSSPSYQPSRSYSPTPSYSHSYTAPSYSHSYSAPSHSYSPPASHYSAPSGGGGGSHYSGGGSHSSGGGGRGGGRR